MAPQRVIDYSSFPEPEDEPRRTIDYSSFPEPERPRSTGILGRLTEPSWTGPSKFMGSIANYLDRPESYMNLPQPFQKPAAMLHGFAAGGLQGVGDLISGLTSPLDLALGATTGGMGAAARRGLTGTYRALKGATRAGGAAVGAEGAHRVATAEDPGDIGQGLLEIAGGIGGMALPSPTVRKPQITPPVLPKEVVTPQANLLKALDESIPLNQQQKDIYAKGHQEKLAKMEAVTATGVEGLHQKKAALAGRYDRVEITPLSKSMTPEQLDDILIDIDASPDLLPHQSVNAQEAMEMLYHGNVPPPNRIKLLQQVFGEDFSQALIKATGKEASLGKQVGNTLAGIQNFQRSLLTAYDFSAPGRQGKFLGSYPEFWKALPTMVRSWGSKNVFNRIQDSINAHPNFTRPTDALGKSTGKSVAERAGLDMTNMLTRREEIFLSKAAEKLPGIPASNRAYVGFLNKLRSDMLNRFVKEEGGDILQNNVKLESIGTFINNATGRGKLPGALEDNAKLMNNIFFAPRLHAGKIRMWAQVFNPRFYAKSTPTIRKAALRSVITSAGFGLMAGALFKQMGAEVSNDPTSSDFRKIKIGDTRVDPFGGDQQYVVAAAKLLSGKSTSSTTGRVTDIRNPGFGEQSSGGVIADFLANRLAPIPSFAVNLLFNRDYGNEDFGVKSELIDKTTPIMVQDIMELMEEDPSLLPLAIPAAFGVGVQSYGR